MLAGTGDESGSGRVVFSIGRKEHEQSRAVSLNALVSECLSVVSLFGHGPIARYGRI